MAVTTSQKIKSFLKDNQGKKIDADYMYDLFFGQYHENQRKQKNIERGKNMQGTTIERRGRPFYLVRYIDTHKKYGNKFEVLCEKCGKGTFESYIQNLKDHSGKCDDCKRLHKQTPWNKGLSLKEQQKKPPQKKRPAFSQMQHVDIPDDLRGSWKEYSDAEYAQKLKEIQESIKK